jgi:hypothetical protein
MSEKEQAIESGDRFSFNRLFKDKVTRLEIPIIQRDYAQGRESSGDVRETFLDALYLYLDENRPNRDLDFVYGSISTGDSVFIPLDGQQRLTTLFLLHWYLAGISSNSNAFREVLSAPAGLNWSRESSAAARSVSRFTYETRASSREFCDALLSNDINFDNLLQPEGERQNSLSRTIRDQGWYFLSWDDDPTIQSMLTMLDAIHGKFEDRPEFFYRLTDDANPVITFLYLDLKHFYLTDDLYIKMNSRGKGLTTFENFKAKIEQHINSLDWEVPTGYELRYQDKTVTISPKEYFSFMIDTTWADLFWNYRDLYGNLNSFDEEIMNFIRTIISNQYASTIESEDIDNLEYLIGTQIAKRRSDYTDNITYQKYKSFKSLTKDAMSYLISAFDALANGDSKIKTHLDETHYFDEHKVFEKVLLHDLILPQRVCFHAYLKFLICNSGNPHGLQDWMRVIHNLTENSVIDGAEEVKGAIKSVDKLLLHGNSVLDYLRGGNVKIDFFAARQVQEERIKAHLIKKSEKWSRCVGQVERHRYFDGQIAFILEFSGILDYYERHHSCSWSEKEDDTFFSLFTNYSEKAAAAFDLVLNQLKLPEADRNYLWERAVLTKGDYLVEASEPRYNLLNSNLNPRYYSWKRLLRLPPSSATKEDMELWQERRCYVKSVLDDPLFDKDDVQGSLEEICKVKPADWRGYFVETPELIRYCKQGFIRWESDGAKILLYRQSQQNHRHVEMFSYYLFVTELKDSDQYLPFKWTHKVVRSSDDQSCAETKEWCYERKHYAITLKIDDAKSDSTRRNIIGFHKTRGNVKQSEISPEIADLLEELNFKWNEESNSYEHGSKSEQKTIAKLKKLCSVLNDLAAP